MASFIFERRLNLPVEELWPILTDFTKAPTPDIKVEVLKTGDPDAGGTGAVRMITIGKDRVRQVLDKVNPPENYAYRITDHRLIKSYYAKIDLKDEENSTLFCYQADLKPAIPFTGGIACAKAKSGLVTLLNSIEKHYCKDD